MRRLSAGFGPLQLHQEAQPVSVLAAVAGQAYAPYPPSVGEGGHDLVLALVKHLRHVVGLIVEQAGIGGGLGGKQVASHLLSVHVQLVDSVRGRVHPRLLGPAAAVESAAEFPAGAQAHVAAKVVLAGSEERKELYVLLADGGLLLGLDPPGVPLGAQEPCLPESQSSSRCSARLKQRLRRTAGRARLWSFRTRATPGWRGSGAPGGAPARARPARRAAQAVQGHQGADGKRRWARRRFCARAVGTRRHAGPGAPRVVWQAAPDHKVAARRWEPAGEMGRIASRGLGVRASIRSAAPVDAAQRRQSHARDRERSPCRVEPPCHAWAGLRKPRCGCS